MGYGHYWRRGLELDRDEFKQAMEDIKEIIEKAKEMGLRLAGPTGEGAPELTHNTIAFNGAKDCGHKFRDLGKPFPAATAEGVEAKDPPYQVDQEPWYSGPYLETRICGGTCAGCPPMGPFVVDRNLLLRDWERSNEAGYLRVCETDFKPYDLVVTAALIRLKERLGDAIIVSSDNPENGFEDAKRICRELFGWPTRFALEPMESELV